MSRGVAQPGSAPALGAGGRAFKSPRPDQRKQLIYWQCRVSARLADQLTSITYPSYRQIQYGLDGADRVTSVKDVASGTNYATVSYTAPGGIDTMSLRNGVSEHVDWNDRSQPIQMQASKSNSCGP